LAKQAAKKYVPDFLPLGTVVEVAKFNMKTGEFVGLKLMTHGEFKSMVKQPSFRYQEYQKGFSQYNK
jgi:hypothetical protein